MRLFHNMLIYNILQNASFYRRVNLTIYRVNESNGLSG